MARQTRQEAREATLARKAAREVKRLRVTSVNWDAQLVELTRTAVTR